MTTPENDPAAPLQPEIRDGRAVCTPETPWSKDYGIRNWQHPDAVHVRDIDYGDAYFEESRCPNCGITFKNEVPS